MPLINLIKEYSHNWYSHNKHLATIIPSMTRRIEGVDYLRERITLPDGDFLDLDWMKGDSNRLLIITHGLEGNSDKHYVKGLARVFFKRGWDVLSWNCRSCSGEMNAAPKLYHHGDILDIGEVLKHVKRKNHYNRIGFAGYSMGGVINTKFIGQSGDLSQLVEFNIAVSTPCDLKSCAQTLDDKRNFIYKNKFQKSLTKKLILKELQFPGIIDLKVLSSVETWREFDEKISAPFNGYKNAGELYDNATINHWLDKIQVPTMILNSIDDPLIPKHTNPHKFAENSDTIYFAYTAKGGHCGFKQKNDFSTFSESFSVNFVDKILNKL